MTNAQTLAMQLSVGNSAGRLNEITGLLTGDAYSDGNEVRARVRATDSKVEKQGHASTKWRAAHGCRGRRRAQAAGSQFGAGDTAEDRAYRDLTG